VTDFNDALRDLADNLLETMRAAPGIGITAPISVCCSGSADYDIRRPSPH
jgi:hypothetical protein